MQYYVGNCYCFYLKKSGRKRESRTIPLLESLDPLLFSETRTRTHKLHLGPPKFQLKRNFRTAHGLVAGL
jgi:hypothetical protein